VQPSSGGMDLDEVASRYTMEDELRIHRTVLGEVDEETDHEETGEVFLWDDEPASAEAPAPGNDGDDLGDNVELF